MSKNKRKTVRFYTNSGLYKGWQYLDKTTYTEAREWLRSGNYILLGNDTLNSFTSITRILNLFDRKITKTLWGK